MKVLAVERMPGAWPDAALRAVEAGEVAAPSCLPVTLLTDSALVREGTPLFLPDFASGWHLEIVPYFTVGRLGKSISPRFVPRYIDGVGVAARLVPPRDKAVGQAWSPYGALASNFDGALAPGRKFALDGWAPDAEMVLATGDGDSVSLRYSDMRIEDTVALVSRYMMLKTGDMILPCSSPLAVPAEIGLRLDVVLDGHQALRLKVK